MREKLFFSVLRQFAELNRRTGKDFTEQVQMTVEQAAQSAHERGDFENLSQAYAHYLEIARREYRDFEGKAFADTFLSIPF